MKVVHCLALQDHCYKLYINPELKRGYMYKSLQGGYYTKYYSKRSQQDFIFLSKKSWKKITYCRLFLNTKSKHESTDVIWVCFGLILYAAFKTW